MGVQYPVGYKPQEKQALFHQCLADEVFYGGAAGGGKSYALLYDAYMFCLTYPKVDAVLFRRTFPELEYYHIQKSRQEWPDSVGKYNASNHCWYFKNGSRLLFRALKDPGDEYEYQSAEFPWIGFDELTHFREDQYSYLASRNRSAEIGPEVPRQVKSASNPGNIGHAWVKRRFINPAVPGELFTVSGQDEELHTRIFLPATVYDNPILLAADPGYLQKLKNLPPHERKKLLEGNWDIAEGQAFPEWNRDLHVVKPFRLPPSWRITMCEDWGYRRPFYIGWIAWDSDNRPWLVNEIYGCRYEQMGDPSGFDKGIQKDPVQVSRAVSLIEKKRGWKGRVKARVLDPACWKEEGAETIANMHLRGGMRGISKGSHNRMQRCLIFHELLRRDPTGEAYFHVFDTCKGFIRTFPELIMDENNPEDVDSDGEDHPYDAVGMGLAAHKLPSAIRRSPGVQDYDRRGDRWKEGPNQGERPWMTV